MEVKPGYRQTELGAIPTDWDVVRLGELAEVVTSGSRGWARFYSETGALFIRSQNVRDVHLCFEDVQHVSPPVGAEGNRTKVRLNDLLITVTGNSVGNVAMVEQAFDEAYISQHVGLVRLKDPDKACFVCRYLSPSSPGNPQIAGSQSGQSKPGLNLQNLKDFLVALPRSKDERQSVATALGDVDNLVQSLERLIAKKRDLKQATMQQLLTGQTRLPGFSGEWPERSFADLFVFSGGFSASREQLSHVGHCYLHYGDIHTTARTCIDLRTDTDSIPRLNVALGQVAPASLLADGDVVFVDASEDVDGTSRHVVVANPEGVPFISGLHTIVAKGKDGSLDREYKRFCFQAEAIKRQFRFYAVGTKVSGVSKTNIARMSMRVPSLPEQKVIAEVLSDMDAEIAALEARLAKTRDLKQGMMQELLTGRTRLV